MARLKVQYRCNACGHIESKWLGRCPQCEEWNTFKEETVSSAKGDGAGALQGRGGSRGSREAQSDPYFRHPVSLSQVEAKEGFRFASGMSEFDRVLGGGVMRGSAVLIGGAPGIGKSTLMMQLLASSEIHEPLLVSGEESAAQIRMRAERLGMASRPLKVLGETRLENLLRILRETKPDLVVIDSIQTLMSEDLGPVPGTVNQLKYCSLELIDWAKEHDAALFLVGHITKDGTLAGPKVIEHMVDTVLYFDQAESGTRIVRSMKNRFGSVDEIGVFTMTRSGLVPAADPASFFLGTRMTDPLPGITAAAVFEGSRTFMVEIQALTVPAKSGISRVYTERIDVARVSRIAAVMERHAGIVFSDQDIYVNVAGGIRLAEVGIELPLALALYSARMQKSMPPMTAASGELSLAGEVRPVGHIGKRLKTARDMGFQRFLGPDLPRKSDGLLGDFSGYYACKDIRQAISFTFRS